MSSLSSDFWVYKNRLHSVFHQSLELDFAVRSYTQSISRFLDPEGISVFHLFSFEFSLNLVVICIGIFLQESEHSLLTEKVDYLSPHETGRV